MQRAGHTGPRRRVPAGQRARSVRRQPARRWRRRRAADPAGLATRPHLAAPRVVVGRQQHQHRVQPAEQGVVPRLCAQPPPAQRRQGCRWPPRQRLAATTAAVARARSGAFENAWRIRRLDRPPSRDLECPCVVLQLHPWAARAVVRAVVGVVPEGAQRHVPMVELYRAHGRGHGVPCVVCRLCFAQRAIPMAIPISEATTLRAARRHSRI
eukprot:7162142-Prymnesium_polylepis.1